MKHQLLFLFSLVCIFVFSKPIIAQNCADNDNIITVVPITCNGSADGSISVEVTGGVAPFQYRLNNDAFQTSNTFTNLFAGIYEVFSIDAEGCEAVNTVMLEDPEFLDNFPVVDYFGCFDDFAGQIQNFTTGGVPPYTYALFEGGFEIFPPTLEPSFFGLPPGVFDVYVTDSNGCATITTVDVLAPDGPLVSQADVISSTSCSGDDSGEIQVSAQGGLEPYQYQLMDSFSGSVIVPFSDSSVFTGVPAGVYNVITRDFSFCDVVLPVEVEVPDPLLNSIEITYISSLDNTIQMIGSGGVEPYIYELIGPTITTIENATGSFIAIPEGTYTAKITDARLCIVESPIVISYIDANLDGIADNDEDVNANGILDDDDTDSDGIPDYLDEDDDNDGVDSIGEVTTIKGFSGKSGENFIDTDEDGIPNHRDMDDDDDGVLTIDEDYNGNGDPTDDDTDGSGVADYLEKNVFILSITDFSKHTQFSVFPIPADRNITISLDKEATQFEKLSLFNLKGELLLNIRNDKSKNKVSVDVSSFSPGIYFVTIEDKSGGIGTRQILIK